MHPKEFVDQLPELKAKRSILEPFLAEIEYCLSSGLSYQQVVQWLTTEDVHTTQQNLHKWISRRRKKAVRALPPTLPATNVRKSPNSDSQTAVQMQEMAPTQAIKSRQIILTSAPPPPLFGAERASTPEECLDTQRLGNELRNRAHALDLKDAKGGIDKY